MTPRLLTIEQVSEYTSFGERTLYRKMASEGFPKSVKAGHRTRRWVREEVDEWLDRFIEGCERGGPAPGKCL